MKGFEQIYRIYLALLDGTEIKHHGGHYCYVNGKQYPAKHLVAARYLAFVDREKRRQESAVPCTDT